MDLKQVAMRIINKMKKNKNMKVNIHNLQNINSSLIMSRRLKNFPLKVKIYRNYLRSCN